MLYPPPPSLNTQRRSDSKRAECEGSAAGDKVFGEGGQGAAHQVEKVKGFFMTSEGVAKMNQLDRSAMNQTAFFQNAAKGEHRRATVAAAQGRDLPAVRESSRERQRVA